LIIPLPTVSTVNPSMGPVLCIAVRQIQSRVDIQAVNLKILLKTNDDVCN